MEEDDRREPESSYLLGADLSRFSVEELNELAERLQEEQARVASEIAKKSDVRSAADSFFR